MSDFETAGVLITIGLLSIALSINKLANVISRPPGLEKYEWRELLQPLSSISTILSQIRDMQGRRLRKPNK